MSANHIHTPWSLEQESVLIDLVGLGLSFSQSATEINRLFGTFFSRNAAVGKAHRIGLHAIEKPKAIPKKRDRTNQRRYSRPTLDPIEPLQIRCDAIEPRHLTLLDLGLHDCKWPFGDSPFTFCGGYKPAEQSYCEAHLQLSRRNS